VAPSSQLRNYSSSMSARQVHPDRQYARRVRVPRAFSAFHEKAGQSQDSFVFTYLDSFPSSRAASVAILPSAVCYERFSLAARWAYSIQ